MYTFFKWDEKQREYTQVLEWGKWEQRVAGDFWWLDDSEEIIEGDANEFSRHANLEYVAW